MAPLEGKSTSKEAKFLTIKQLYGSKHSHKKEAPTKGQAKKVVSIKSKKDDRAIKVSMMDTANPSTASQEAKKKTKRKRELNVSENPAKIIKKSSDESQRDHEPSTPATTMETDDTPAKETLTVVEKTRPFFWRTLNMQFNRDFVLAYGYQLKQWYVPQQQRPSLFS